MNVYIYRWGTCGGKYRDLKGRRCTVLARGAMNSCLVEWEGGGRDVISRNALRRAAAQ